MTGEEQRISVLLLFFLGNLSVYKNRKEFFKKMKPKSCFWLLKNKRIIIQSRKENTMRKSYFKQFIAAALMGTIVLQAGCGTGTIYAIENEKVKVAEYKGIQVEKEEPITVDDEYLQEKFKTVVDFYNTYSGTEYEGTDDETVAAVTGGSYSTYEEWADSVRDGYTQGEAEDAVANMAQQVFTEVFSKSELLGYTQEEYDAEKEAVEEGFLSYSGASSIEEYQEMEELTAEEYAEVLDTTVLYFLKYRYVLDAIGETEGIAPTEEEIMDEYIYAHLENDLLEEGREEWNEEYTLLMESYEDYYYSELFSRVLDFLYEYADIQ